MRCPPTSDAAVGGGDAGSRRITPGGLARAAETLLGLGAAVWAGRPAWEQLALVLARRGEPGDLLRWWLAVLLALPPVLALVGLILSGNLRGSAARGGFGAVAPLLAGAAGTAANVVGAGRGTLVVPAGLLLAVALVRCLRVRPHPLAVAGTAVTGFALVGLGYVAWVMLLLAGAGGAAAGANGGGAGGGGAAGAIGGGAGGAAGAGAPGDQGVTVQTVTGGLEVPWALGFLGREEILLTERPGRVRLVRQGRLTKEPILTLPVAAEGEGGLLGLAVHPRYPAKPWIYLYYTYRRGDGRLANRVARYTVRRAPAGEGVRLDEPAVILDGVPGARFHDGGRLRFGPDGKLYVTTGDAGQPRLAADRRSLAGKVLRLEDDGRVPRDNPFPGSPVWSYGHRNPQGLAWDAAGRLYVVEHGPSGEFGLCCRDEVNLVVRGGFYGWPYRAAGTRAGGGRPPATPRDPVATSGAKDTWAPGGVGVVPWPGHPWRGDLLVTALRGERLLRLRLAQGHADRVAAVETVLRGYGRLRDLVPGPDGCLYFTTSNRDGRGRPVRDDDRLLRLCPGATGLAGDGAGRGGQAPTGAHPGAPR